MDWQKVMARLLEICNRQYGPEPCVGDINVPRACSPRRQSCCRERPGLVSRARSRCTPGLTHKRKVGRVARVGLDEKLVAPAVERLKAPRVVDVVHEDAAVGAAVEGHAQRLEAFLASRVPELSRSASLPLSLSPRTLLPGDPSQENAPPCLLPPTCIVTCLSSMMTSRVRKSAPIVAL